MRIRPFDIGVESIGQWQEADEVHLPKDGSLPQVFLPEWRPLDAILRRPSIDERLPGLLAPSTLDPDLLNPGLLSETRLEMKSFFLSRSESESRVGARKIFAAAAALLDNDATLDHEVRSALAILLKG